MEFVKSIEEIRRNMKTLDGYLEQKMKTAWWNIKTIPRRTAEKQTA